MSFSWARIRTFLVALGGMLALWLFLTRTYIGTAIRAIAQDRQIMPLMGVDSRKLYLVTSAIGGGLAGLAAALMVLQYDIYPQIGLQFGPLIFMICVLGGLGNMIGGFIAAFIISQFIAVGARAASTPSGATPSPSCSSWWRSSSGRRGCSGASHEPALRPAARSSASLRCRRAAARCALLLRRRPRNTTCTC